jgi:hypothetical protein
VPLTYLLRYGINKPSHFFCPGLCYAVIFGQVTAIVQQSQKKSEGYHETLDNMRSFCTLYNVPKEIATRIIDYYMYTWVLNRGVDTNQVSAIIYMLLQLTFILDSFLISKLLSIKGRARSFLMKKPEYLDKIPEKYKETLCIMTSQGLMPARIAGLSSHRLGKF